MENNTPAWVWVFWIVVGVYIYRRSQKKKQTEKEEKEKSAIEEKELVVQKNLKIESKLKKADELKIKLSEIQEIEVIDVSNFKSSIIENEKIIIENAPTITATSGSSRFSQD